MLIRMTDMGTSVGALIAALVVGAGGVLGSASSEDGPAAARKALVIDAAAARDGSDLLDDRLMAIDAEVRVARTAAEARTNVRYFAEQGYDIVVTGPVAGEAAGEAGVGAERAAGLGDALALAGR
jgi:hypothetical protein